MTRSLTASLLVAAALAVAPAGALAQDAGGHQYDDPLAGTPSGPSTPSTPSSGSTGTSGSSTGTPGSSTGTTSAATASTANSTTPTAAATATGAGEIPRTGFPVGWLTLSGFLALGVGVALRRAAGFESA
jgi:hypothetical protein